MHKQDEKEWSHHNFSHADVDMYVRHFADYQKQAQVLLNEKLVLPAYDYTLKCSHIFNLLDARGAARDFWCSLISDGCGVLAFMRPFGGVFVQHCGLLL